MVTARSQRLPGQRSQGLDEDTFQEDTWFIRLTFVSVLAGLMVLIWLGTTPHPDAKTVKKAQTQHRARLILPKPEPLPKLIKPQKVKAKPMAKPKPKPKPMAKPKPKASPEQNRSKAQLQARNTAMADLAAISQDLGNINRNESITRVGRQRPLAQSTGMPPPTEVVTSLIEQRARQTSQGIDDIQTKLKGPQVGLTEHITEVVEDQALALPDTPTATPPEKPFRDLAEVSRRISAYRKQFNTLYKRALRREPGLSGKVVIRVTIETDGTVSECLVVSSDLHSNRLERRIIRRIQKIDFGREDVVTTTTDYTLEFGS